MTSKNLVKIVLADLREEDGRLVCSGFRLNAPFGIGRTHERLMATRALCVTHLGMRNSHFDNSASNRKAL